MQIDRREGIRELQALIDRGTASAGRYLRRAFELPAKALGRTAAMADLNAGSPTRPLAPRGCSACGRRRGRREGTRDPVERPLMLLDDERRSSQVCLGHEAKENAPPPIARFDTVAANRNVVMKHQRPALFVFVPMLIYQPSRAAEGDHGV